MKKRERKIVIPHIQSLLDKVNKMVKEYSGLEGFQVKELTISRTHKTDMEDCPCGSEPVMLRSGKIVEDYKKCSPQIGRIFLMWKIAVL